MRNVVIVLSKKRLVFPVIITMLILGFSFTFIMISPFVYKNVLEGKTVAIDAGHGGVDGGASNSYILEKDINLDVALKVRDNLENNGASVIMTRVKDVELSQSKKIDYQRYRKDLKTRTNIINNSSANMFLSIHTNSNKNKPSTRGMIAFYANSHPHNREMAYIFQNIFNTYGFSYNDVIYKSHHIPQRGEYYILMNSKIPGIIVETGFITNPTDLMLLQKIEYREYLADAIYQGVIDYFLKIDKMPKNNDDKLEIEEEKAIELTHEDFEN